ncbi:MAG: hypothetical protein ACI8PZ_001965 [Myxococcota bacterium]|jgi:hypothetical protein
MRSIIVLAGVLFSTVAAAAPQLAVRASFGAGAGGAYPVGFAHSFSTALVMSETAKGHPELVLQSIWAPGLELNDYGIGARIPVGRLSIAAHAGVELVRFVNTGREPSSARPFVDGGASLEVLRLFPIADTEAHAMAIGPTAAGGWSPGAAEAPGWGRGGVELRFGAGG